MAPPIILRVKRKLEEDPADALIVYRTSTKKARINEDEDPALQQKVFRFAGTVANEKSEVVSHFISDALRQEKSTQQLHHDRNPKSRASKIIPKLRSEHRKASHQNRLQIVNARRHLPEAGDMPDHLFDGEGNDTEKEAMNLYKLYDVIETEPRECSINEQLKDSQKDSLIAVNGIPLVRRPATACGPNFRESCEEGDWVYDLYFTTEVDDANDFLSGDYSVEKLAFTDELVHDDYRDVVDAEYEDEDDSNDENNWRNEYPEEDGDFFENEYDFFREYEDEEEKEMIRRFQANALSCDGDESDEDVEDYELLRHQEDDVIRHGLGYARYKARMLRELDDEDGYSYDDEDDD